MADCAVSVVIATRDRVPALSRLLKCVQQQDFTDFECIVVDDASSNETIEQYDAIWRKLDNRFMLIRQSTSGGPAKSRNAGIEASNGYYVAFCDDDDYWIRSDHLSVAVRSLNRSKSELFVSNMQTSVDGNVFDPNWYHVLSKQATDLVIGENDVYIMELNKIVKFLYNRIFHANTMVVARALLGRINLYWDKIRFAEDHDLSFRLADAANGVIYRTTVTADLDVSNHPSIARSFSEQERIMFGILACIHAESAMLNPLLRKVVRSNRAWRLLELADIKMRNGCLGTASEFAWQAAVIKLSYRSIKMLLDINYRKWIGQ